MLNASALTARTAVSIARLVPCTSTAIAQHPAVANRLREIALVRDPDELVAGAERAYHLGGGRQYDTTRGSGTQRIMPESDPHSGNPPMTVFMMR